ncbi:HD domain-containing protein [Streptosporangium sp. G11]|uniref:HD domain-containing protein n=1 Tax=Streptosporangium sp. G11 TaxID=3436926 RepID=UPI003EBA33D4
MTTRIADVGIPGGTLAEAATELVRAAAEPLVYDHSRRVFLFGALAGDRKGLVYDPELLYVGAMFHDLGLTRTYRTSDQRFEIDGADEARRFLREHGVSEEGARVVWEAIALHTTPEIPHHMAPEIALVTTGVEADVLGIGLDDIPDEAIAEIVAAHPRPDFKRRILAAFTDGIAHRPQTTFGNVKADVLERFVPGYVRTNFVDVIENSAWPE